MRLILCLFLFIGSALANELMIKLNEPELLINHTLEKTWQVIPKEYHFSKSPLANISPNISADLENATLITTKLNNKLFNLSVIDKNNLQLKWYLNEIELNSLVKIRFKFKMYGVKITHDEYFIVDANGINDANSNLSFDYLDHKINVVTVDHQNFKFNKIKVRPKNGVGNILKFIFENIFSKRKVELYLKTQINKILNDWINGNELIEIVQNDINEKLQMLNHEPISITENGPKIFINPTFFEVSPNSMSFSFNTKINTMGEKVHDCSKNLVQKDDLNLSKYFIENLLSFYMTYEVYEDQQLQEPILCIGHKEYDEQEEPKGEDAQIDIAGKQINFKYWVTPNQYPKYFYDHENQNIQLDLDVSLALFNDTYPLIKTTNNDLKIKAKLNLNFIFNKSEGLSIKIENIQIYSITGGLRLRAFKLSPWISLPMNQVRIQLEKAINQSLRETKSSLLLKSYIEISEKIHFLLNDFKMNEKSYQLFFNIKELN